MSLSVPSFRQGTRKHKKKKKLTVMAAVKISAFRVRGRSCEKGGENVGGGRKKLATDDGRGAEKGAGAAL